MNQFGSFSDAIRYGARLNPQGFHFLRTVDGGTCAIGAGIVALGYVGDAEEAWLTVAPQFPYLTQKADPKHHCPAACGVKHGLLFRVITHLNDDHRWTREQIADWLQSEEDKLGYVTLTESTVAQPAEVEVAV